ncbi:MAG: hypothetical protein KKD17_02795 [Nanoarchaeota archaeon]|nr:hypothetical protein [Nanoarchaeota archaeon]
MEDAIGKPLRKTDLKIIVPLVIVMILVVLMIFYDTFSTGGRAGSETDKGQDKVLLQAGKFLFWVVCLCIILFYTFKFADFITRR